MHNQKKIAILSLGGSLVVPDGVDPALLRSFKKTIEKQVRQGWKFIIVPGGGQTSRRYQAAAKKVMPLTDTDLDWIGVQATRLNAHLVRTLLKKNAYSDISTDPEKKITTAKPIIVASGWKPGWSSDYVSVKMCEVYSIPTMINLTNIDYVYTKDPRKYKNATKITDCTWTEFQKIVGTIWRPGSSHPFGPIAARYAKKIGLDVYIINGRKIQNMEKLLLGKPFNGTHLHP